MKNIKFDFKVLSNNLQNRLIMFSRSVVWKIVRIKFKQFCKHSTIHGIYYFSTNTSWWIQAIWSIVIACSVSLCVYLSDMIWNKFIDNPTFTVVETTHYRVDNIPFPAVAICDSEMVYGPNTLNFTQILRFRDYNETEINDFYASFTKIKSKDYTPNENVKKMHSVLEELGYTYENLTDTLKKPCDVLIKECVWRSHQVDCSKMFRPVFSIMGYCCQFDVQYFREQAGVGVNIRTGTEVSEAMDIIVNSQRTLYNGTVEDSYEFLYVFDKQDNLTLLNRPITLTPLTYFDVTVNVWAIDSSSDVKALSLDTRKCFLPSDNEVIANSYQGCVTVLMMRKVIGHCRCIPFNYDPKELEVEDFRRCSWERLKCIYKMIDQVQNDMRNIILEYECYQRCDYVQFDTEADYIKSDRFPIGTAERNTRVSVHFADNTCIKYKREVLYTWDQMLANLGGIFGLCLGGSIISVIELIWFVLELVFTFFGSKNKVAEEKETKMVFTLTKNNFTNTSSKFKTQKIGRYPFLN